MKKIGIALYGLLSIITIVLVIHLSILSSPSSSEDTSGVSYIKGKIIRVVGNNINVELLDGSKQVITTQLDEKNINYSYRKGQTVLLYVAQSSQRTEIHYDIADFYHLDGLIIVFILFAGIVILVARKKGVYALISVCLSLFLFYFIFINLVKNGYPVLLSGLLYATIILGLTIPLIHGFNKKSLSALISVSIGYSASLAIIYIVDGFVQLGDSPSEEFRNLIIQYSHVNIKDILITSLFLGAIGALIDIAITISSAVFESFQENPHTNFKQAYRLGLNVGKDILGSMINTLLIAYLAASLPFFILIALGNFGNLEELLNYDLIALELSRTLIGGISMILLIPLVAFISAYLVGKQTTPYHRVRTVQK